MEGKTSMEVIKQIENSLLYGLLGLKVRSIRSGYCEMYLPAGQSLNNSPGAFNLGVFIAVCNLAAAAASSTIAEVRFPVNFSSHISVLSQVSSGTLTISAQHIKGEYASIIETRISDEQNRLIAVATPYAVKVVRKPLDKMDMKCIKPFMSVSRSFVSGLRQVVFRCRNNK